MKKTKTFNDNYCFKIQDSRFKILDSRFMIQVSRFKIDLRSSLLTLGKADASLDCPRREWGLTPLCEAVATFSGYSKDLSRLSLNRSLQDSRCSRVQEL
ncbi:MAG: hypothetical protein IJR69_05205 [Bacteroidaceae bacterium]|nr:hypothetical protein [Bacteroidaceae bacterium]